MFYPDVHIQTVLVFSSQVVWNVQDHSVAWNRHNYISMNTSQNSHYIANQMKISLTFTPTEKGYAKRTKKRL